MTTLRKMLTAALATTMLVGTISISTPASAWGYGWGRGAHYGWGGGWRRGWGYGGWGYGGWGGGAAAGLLGGLAIGTIAGAAATSPYYGGYGYYGAAYPTAYPYGYGYGARCTCW